MIIPAAQKDKLSDWRAERMRCWFLLNLSRKLWLHADGAAVLPPEELLKARKALENIRESMLAENGMGRRLSFWFKIKWLFGRMS